MSDAQIFLKTWLNMFSHPGYFIYTLLTVQVVPTLHHDAKTIPWCCVFGIRAVWSTLGAPGSMLTRSEVCILLWRYLSLLVPLWTLVTSSYNPPPPDLTCVDSHLSMLVSLLSLYSHASYWQHHSSSCRSSKDASAKSASHLSANIHVDWSSTDQYEEIQLFHESIKSWLHFHSIPNEPDDKGVWL